jgi:hypothetical protein
MKSFQTYLIASTIFMCANAYAQNSDQTTHTLTNAEILAFLPQNSKLADDILLHWSENRSEKKYQNPVIYADTDVDGQKEIVVAYYTPPHEYMTNGKENAGYFERAHVCVLHWNGAKFIKQWDSGGRGRRFLAKYFNTHTRKIEDAYYANNFNVIDINRNGILDIVFSTESEGTTTPGHFEAWEWEETTKTYRRIAEASACRLVDLDNDGTNELVLDDQLYTDKIEYVILWWNKDKGEYQRETKYKAPGAPQVPPDVIRGDPLPPGSLPAPWDRK